MFCTKCGNEIKDNAKFCGSCGASTFSVNTTQSSPTTDNKAKQVPKQFSFKRAWLRSTIVLTLIMSAFFALAGSFEDDLVSGLIGVFILAAILSVLVAFFIKWRNEGFKIEKDVSLEGLGRDKAKSDVIQGLFWMIGGIIFTGVTYAIADAGGTYFVAWGAVIFGGIQFLRGLATYHSNGGIPRNLIIGCLIGVAVVGSIGYLYYEDQQSKLSVLDLKQGDCFSSNKSFDSEATELATVDIVSCGTGQWDYRVERAFSLTVSGSTYPGQTFIDSQAESGCPATTDTYFFPTTESWGEGDRSILCLSAR